MGLALFPRAARTLGQHRRDQYVDSASLATVDPTKVVRVALEDVHWRHVDRTQVQGFSYGRVFRDVVYFLCVHGRENRERILSRETSSEGRAWGFRLHAQVVRSLDTTEASREAPESDPSDKGKIAGQSNSAE